ncbi:hypothetical protein EMIT0P44_450037 [Pseudomonas sp. IT-P44]
MRLPGSWATRRAASATCSVENWVSRPRSSARTCRSQLAGDSILKFCIALASAIASKLAPTGYWGWFGRNSEALGRCSRMPAFRLWASLNCPRSLP